MEEKVVFERAFHMHGKNFHRLKAFVSHHTVMHTCCVAVCTCCYACTVMCVGGAAHDMDSRVMCLLVCSSTWLEIVMILVTYQTIPFHFW